MTQLVTGELFYIIAIFVSICPPFWIGLDVLFFTAGGKIFVILLVYIENIDEHLKAGCWYASAFSMNVTHALPVQWEFEFIGFV